MVWGLLALLGIHQDQLKGGMVHSFFMESEKFWHAYRRDTDFIWFYSYVAGSTNKKCYNWNKSEKHQLLTKKPKLKLLQLSHSIHIPEQVTTFIYKYTPQTIKMS
jgi:hypothetical protein